MAPAVGRPAGAAVRHAGARGAGHRAARRVAAARRGARGHARAHRRRDGGGGGGGRDRGRRRAASTRWWRRRATRRARRPVPSRAAGHDARRRPAARGRGRSRLRARRRDDGGGLQDRSRRSPRRSTATRARCAPTPRPSSAPPAKPVRAGAAAGVGRSVSCGQRAFRPALRGELRDPRVEIADGLLRASRGGRARRPAADRPAPACAPAAAWRARRGARGFGRIDGGGGGLAVRASCC